MGQESAGSKIVKTLLGLYPPPQQSAEQALYQERWRKLEDSFDKDFYPVREARDELARRGLEIHLETLRRWIRDNKVTVSGPNRRTVIHRGELTRILMDRAQ